MTTNRFRRTRDDHAMETAEDYVELIEALANESGEARRVDIATRMGVSHVTVSKTVQRLIREGLVASLPYRSLFLTEKGKALATAARERHRLVLAFLLELGVNPDVAEEDAEGIEHHVSPETLDRMRAFIEQRRPAGVS